MDGIFYLYVKNLREIVCMKNSVFYCIYNNML